MVMTMLSLLLVTLLQVPGTAPVRNPPAATIADPDGEYVYRLPDAGDDIVGVERSGQQMAIEVVGAYPIVKLVPRVRGVLIESRCATETFTCQLRLFRSGVMVGIATIPMGAMLSDDVSGEWLVAITPIGATRIRTIDMVIDRVIPFARPLEPIDSFVTGPGARKSFVLVGDAVVVVDLEQSQIAGTINIVSKDTAFVSGLKIAGLIGLAGVAVLINPTAVGEAIAANGRVSAGSGERETELTLTPSGRDVEVRHKSSERVIVVDGVTGTIVWDTHYRQK